MVFLYVLLAWGLKKLPLHRIFLISIAFLFIVVTLLQHEYFSHSRIRWDQARLMKVETGLVTQLHVEGNHTKYSYALKTGNLTGKQGFLPSGLNYKCYVQKYTLDTDSKVLAFTQGIDNILQKKIENPKIYKSSKNSKISRVKNNLDKLTHNDEYFSPIYNLVGKKAFVGSFCADEDKK